MDVQPTREDIRAFVLGGLKSWHAPEPTIPHVEKLTLLNGGERTAHSRNVAIRQLLEQSVEQLDREGGADATLIRLHYFNKWFVKEIATERKLTLEQVKYRIRQGVDQLAVIVEKEETQARRDAVRRLRSFLPLPSYHTLYGNEDVRRALTTQLTSAEPKSWLHAVVGIGGIGKTSLVREAVFEAAGALQLDELLWMRVQNGRVVLEGGRPMLLDDHALITTLLTRLDPTFATVTDRQAQRQRLHRCLEERKTLLVVDNLEVATELERVIMQLYSFLNPLKVIITSREQPSDAYHVNVNRLNELGRTATLQLIRQQAEERNVPMLTAGNERLVASIYEAVGGNPLAVKLIVGLAKRLELAELLADLITATHRHIDQMYRYIFERAWGELGETAQALLMIMPLATDNGMTLERMRVNSGLDFGQLGEAIDELSQRSLLDVGGTTVERKYTIHQLTRAYLASDVINWSGTMPGS